MHSLVTNIQPSRLSWWLRLTAPNGAQQYDRASTLQAREHLRRATLTSWTAPFVFFAPLLLIQQASDIKTLVAIIILMSASIVALFLNRIGAQVMAALLLIIAMDASIEGALLASGGLSSGWLLSFDLFVIPLITSGILLKRRFLWTFAVLHICFILGDFYLLPHTQDLVALIAQWHGPSIAFARPIIIQIGCCLLSFLELGSTQHAIQRADRAQLIASLQASIAQEKEQLENGVQEVLLLLTNAANGNFNHHPSLPQESSLWQVQGALSTLFARLQSSKQAEVKLQRVEQDMRQLITLLQAYQRKQPVQWPLPNGGPLDPLIHALRSFIGLPTPPRSR